MNLSRIKYRIINKHSYNMKISDVIKKKNWMKNCGKVDNRRNCSFKVYITSAFKSSSSVELLSEVPFCHCYDYSTLYLYSAFIWEFMCYVSKCFSRKYLHKNVYLYLSRATHPSNFRGCLKFCAEGFSHLRSIHQLLGSTVKYDKIQFF